MAVSGVFPGKIFQVTLGAGEKFVVEQHAFLAADVSVKYTIKMMNVGAALLGGSGWYLLEFLGPGNIFLHVVGDIVEHDDCLCLADQRDRDNHHDS